MQSATITIATEKIWKREEYLRHTAEAEKINRYAIRSWLGRLPYYMRLTWVPFNVRFINVDLIQFFFCQNGI